ncbi:MAG TPA: ATP-binding protein [Candidatus Baltobacteraceae bacterium]|nr:ATP-binding protein [Candidatus Baltobacteraceae bacterium]
MPSVLQSAGGTAAERIDIRSDSDVVRVRQTVRALALKAALSIVDQTKIVTAASELARNTLIHGGGGHAELELVTEHGRQGVRALFSDEGPGIPDIPRAMSGGFSTGGGLGLGLSGSRRLVDGFDLDTAAGRGTRVTVVKWTR